MIGMVYGDLSGDEASIVTAGCYLGKQDEWLNAIAAWSAALDDAGVKEFHATDFYNAKRQFDDDKWRREVAGRICERSSQPNAQVQLRASQIRAFASANADNSVARRLQRTLESTALGT